MRNKTILLLCSALLSGSLSLSLLGCGGCASTQPRSGAASPSFQGIEILPEEKELSPAAKDTYAYLLYMQALADEDEELLLQAAQQMTGGTLPAKAWLEGALWLDSRRSERVLPLLELGLARRSAPQSVQCRGPGGPRQDETGPGTDPGLRGAASRLPGCPHGADPAAGQGQKIR